MLFGIDLTPLVHSLSYLTRPDVIGLVLLGNLIGLFFGFLPGVSGGQAFIVALPLTFGWEPEVAIWFLMGMLGASPFGGAMSSILINVPGDTQSAATAFDGYPMTKRGESTRALGIAAVSDIAGASIGMLVLVALFPLMQTIVLSFGPPELFWLAVLGLFTIAIAAQGSFVKGLVGGGFGALLGLVGFSSVMSVNRYTLGTDYLFDGVQLVSLFVGLFAIAQSIEFCVSGKRQKRVRASFSNWRLILTGAADVVHERVALARSAAIGALGGMIPGIGATAASMLSYAIGKQFSRNPGRFHNGSPEGLISAETAVSAKELGGLMPMLAFGIPGSLEAVLILAALILHGIQPGPFLLRDHAGVVWSIVLALWVSNVVGTSLGLALSNVLARLTSVRTVYLAPVVLALSMVGTYIWRGNFYDMLVAIVAGLFGYILRQAGFSLVTFIIGFLLAGIAERAFYQSVLISNGSLAIFFSRPAAIAVFGITALFIGVVFWRTQQVRRESAPVAARTAS
jgi:putative tricarboxylic transport membrane protein